MVYSGEKEPYDVDKKVQGLATHSFNPFKLRKDFLEAYPLNQRIKFGVGLHLLIIATGFPFLRFKFWTKLAVSGWFIMPEMYTPLTGEA